MSDRLCRRLMTAEAGQFCKGACIIKEMGQKENLAVIMTIHDLNLASMFCDKLLMLKSGKVFAYGKTDNVLTEENIKTVYNVQTAVSIADGCKHIRLVRGNI